MPGMRAPPSWGSLTVMGRELQMKKLVGAVFAMSLAVSGVAAAEEPAKTEAAKTEAAPAKEEAPAKKPQADAVKAVWDFYMKGKGGGVVLADAKACNKVGKEGDTKFECTEEIGPEGVKAGTNILIWQAYLIPQGDTVDDITLQVKQGDTVRETKDISVKGDYWRTRTWTGVRIPKAGDWTIVLSRGNETLKSLNVKATK